MKVDFGREAISVQNIGFFDVETDVVSEINEVIGEADDAVDVKSGKDDVAVVIVAEGAVEDEIGEVGKMNIAIGV